ncbi:MAG: hypothetical protein MK135_01145 [Polyangiaceae bacterium]|nr:hypothetical protein [Polyangiaceae bacterium]
MRSLWHSLAMRFLLTRGLFLTPLFLLGSGCQRQLPVEDPVVALPETASEEPDLLPLEGSSAETVLPTESEAMRRVGDHFVHQIKVPQSAFPFELVEEVVATRRGSVLVEYRLFLLNEQGRPSVPETNLRVEVTRRAERIVRVEEWREGAYHQTTLDAYADLMARLTLAPEKNLGKLESKQALCLVGEEEFDCERSSFQVKLGKSEAILSVAKHAGLGRDLEGELRAVDGTILYKSQVTEIRRGTPGTSAKQKGVARLDFDERR